MKRCLVIGATSAIAVATARALAARGDALFLVARDAARLQALAEDLRVRGAPRVDTALLDVDELAAHAAVLDQAWTVLGQVDIALMAHGTLPDQTACNDSLDATLAAFHTNATASIALVAAVAARLRQAHAGTLAVISSVAGDRGRASNYLYGAAKAAVSAYTGGLRQRLASEGVNVLTIKPGLVDTPMTRHLRKNALWAQPEQVARGIVRAIDARRSVVYLPWFWRPIMALVRAVPEPLFRRMRM
ncbi:MAG TPA: SDR family oxidoreductase [Gammaproteobacteria bacterium]|nr:SDR family oxidoreductase [Gammaproteobacteria bacterium]